MKRKYLLTAAGAAAALVLSTAHAASAQLPPPQPGDEPPHPRCLHGQHWDDEAARCAPTVVPQPASPPGASPATAAPKITVEMVRQTHTLDGIRIQGWATDPDAPTTPLTIRVSVDGKAPTTAVADTPRADLGDAAHGFAVVVPATADGHRVCVTAVGIGAGGDVTDCRDTDRILRFDGHRIAYDLTRAVLQSAVLAQLDRVNYTNGSTVAQHYEINRTSSIRNTHSWTVTAGLTVKWTGEVGVPSLVGGKWEVTGSVQYAANGSTEEVQTFSWRQPVDVPAKSRLVAVASATKSTVAVPYVIEGSYVFGSGAEEDGEVSGRYAGVTSQDADVVVQQFDLAGNPMLTAPSPVTAPAGE